MTKNDLVFAISEIKDEYIEASEKKENRRTFGKLGSLVLAAVLVLAFSVTAIGAAVFFNTLDGGDMVFVEAAGEYMGDVYKITFDVEVSDDAKYIIEDYYVPTYLEENWVDCGGDASETTNVMVYDNYDKNWYAIFQQHPAFYHKNGAYVSFNVPAGTEMNQTYFEFEGEKIFCIETQPCFDGFTGDPFGTRILFWSDGYYIFELETRLTMDDDILREIIKSIRRVDDISDYVPFHEIPD